MFIIAVNVLLQDASYVIYPNALSKKILMTVFLLRKNQRCFNPEIVASGSSDLKTKLPATKTFAPTSNSFFPVS